MESREASSARRPTRRRRALRWLARLAFVATIWGAGCHMMSFPGESWSGPLPPWSPEESTLAASLRAHVEKLAGEIGSRCVWRPEGLRAARSWLLEALIEMGHAPETQAFEADGVTCENILVELPGDGRRDEIVVVGAHYDTCYDTPGANDNASGVAALLELARRFRGVDFDRTLRLVLFVNEEPPYFQTELMGSVVAARRSRARGEKVVAMVALETMGYFSDEEGSQQYPAGLSLFYPSKGDFIGFVGALSSRALVARAIGVFREGTAMPSEGGAMPGFLPGVGWSDHWSYAQEGYPAIMVTDTAPFRYPWYHDPGDTPEKLDYERLARITLGISEVVRDLLDGE